MRAALAAPEPAVIALGGGAVTTPREPRGARGARSRCCATSTCDTAWLRVAQLEPAARAGRGALPRASTRSGSRSTARSPTRSRPTSTAPCSPPAVVHHGRGSLDLLGELVPGDGPVALVADAHVMGIYGPRAQQALGDRLTTTHELPAGEEAKAVGVLRRLWSELRLDRDGTLVALGGGCTTDVAGFAAATYLRGVPWAAVPTSLVGQVDAAIGGKTAIDIPEGKNLVGAFHWPARVVIDEALLDTLPERERRQGMAELVKTRLLAGAARAPDADAAPRAYKSAHLPARPARPRAARAG